MRAALRASAVAASGVRSIAAIRERRGQRYRQRCGQRCGQRRGQHCEQRCGKWCGQRCDQRYGQRFGQRCERRCERRRAAVRGAGSAAGSAVGSAVGNGAGSAASGAASGAAGSGAGSALLFSRVLKHDGGARLSTVPSSCEWSPGAVNATHKCRFLGTCLCECHAYQYTQKCLLSAMVCVAQKALVFLCKRPPTWDPSFRWRGGITKLN